MKKIKLSSCLILTGIGDYSITREFYKKNIIDKEAAMLAHNLQKCGVEVCFIDVRDNFFSKTLLLCTIKNLQPDCCIVRLTQTNGNNIFNLNLQQYFSEIYLLSDFDCQDCFSDSFLSLVWNNRRNYEENMQTLLRKLCVIDANTVIEFSCDFWQYARKTAFPCSITVDLDFENAFHKSLKRDIVHIFSEIDYIVNTLKHKTIYLECSDYYADTEHLNNLFGHIAENYNAVFSIELPLEFIIKFVKNDNNFPSNVRQIFINIKQINFVEHTLIVSSIKHLFDKGIVSIVLKCDEKTICQSENSITYFVTFSNEILQSVPNIEFYSVESVFEKAQQAIMQQVRNRILLLMQQNICKMTFEKKIKHVETNLSGVNTQIYAYFLTKTPIPKVYQNVKKQILSKFSFEIKDDFLLYCPVFYSIIEYDNEDKPYIPLSSFLTQSNDFVRYLNDIEFQLLQQAIRYKINKEIVNFISSQNKITFDEAKKMVVDFYLFVENVGLMSFTKILKKH